MPDTEDPSLLEINDQLDQLIEMVKLHSKLSTEQPLLTPADVKPGTLYLSK